MLILYKGLLYGCLGLLLEVFFTGFHSLWTRNWRATCQTYLWMWPVYGGTALLLELLHNHLHWPAMLAAVGYLPVIYGAEFGSGWLLEKLIGKCPWHYGNAKWGIMGLVRLDYIGWWYLAGLGFDLACGVIHRVLEKVCGLV